MKKKNMSLSPGMVVTLVGIYYSVGIAGLIIHATREYFRSAISFTLLASVFILAWYHGKFSRRQVTAAMLVFAAGYLVEVAGVATGLLFGDYHYGGSLGPRVFGTPLMIGVNWLFLVYCSNVIAGRFVEPLYFRSLVAGSMMVVFDIALEPSAMWLGMWDWAGGVVPLQNYLAWFVIAVGLNYLAGAMRLPNPKNKLAAPLFFIQLVFFLLLDIWMIFE